MTARIYVASRASTPARASMWKALREQGYPIISTWIDEAGDGETNDFADLWERIVREVGSATTLVMYAEPQDFPVRGVLVEVGMALAAGVPVHAVLPRVILEGRSMRPVGSWMHHPLVRKFSTLEHAMDAAVWHAKEASLCASQS